MDFYTKIRAEVKQFDQSLIKRIMEVTRNNGQNLSSITSYLRANREERNQASNMMAETIIKFSVPLAYRYLLHLAENGAEVKFIPAFSSDEVGREDWNKVMEQVKEDGIELMKVEENRKLLRNCAAKVKKYVERFFAYERKIQDEISIVDRFLLEKLMPTVDASTVINFVKWAHTVFFGRL